MFFVTRLKDGAAYTDVPEKARPAAGDRILSDRVITFDNQKPDENGKRPEFRIVKDCIGGKHGIFTYFKIAGKYIETQVNFNYSVQYMLDRTGGKYIKIFRGGQPHLEIVAFRDASVVGSTPIMRFYFVLDRSAIIP